MLKAERQALRYRTDPEYRKNHIKTAVMSNKKRRTVKAMHDDIKWRELNVIIKGEKCKLKCCRIGDVAMSVDRTVQTIRLWERHKWIPKTLTYKGHRYYTFKQWELFVQAHQNAKDINDFFSIINNNWSYK